MARNYVGWYGLKAKIENSDFSANFSEREVWWCSLGANIGDEEDGKNDLFERPVLIVKKYSKSLFLGLPLSTRAKESRFYYPVSIGDSGGVVLLSQSRVLSSKRLQRRLGRVSAGVMRGIITQYAELNGIKSAPQQVEGPRAPSGDLYPHYTKRKRNSQDHVALKTSNELK